MGPALAVSAGAGVAGGEPVRGAAGIDMALHLAARLAGDQRARDVRRYI